MINLRNHIAILAALCIALPAAPLYGEPESSTHALADGDEETAHGPISQSMDFDEIVVTAAPHPAHAST